MLFALGFTLVFGILGVINPSYGAVFILDAYVALQVVLHSGLSPWAALAVGFVVSGVAGLIINVLLSRPLRRRNVSHLIPMIATIGTGIATNGATQSMFEVENLRPLTGLISDASLDLGGIHLTLLELSIIVLSFVLMAMFMLLLKHAQLGHALRAIAESSKAAALLSINVEGLFLLTSSAAAVLGGLSGVLIGSCSNTVFPLMGQSMLHKGIAVIILGGLGDVCGAVLGGLFLGLVEVPSVAYTGSTIRDAVTFDLLFLILLVRPQGLFNKVLERKA